MNSAQTKILFISHESSIAGSTVSLTSLIQGLKKYNKLDVSVLLPYKKSGTSKELLSKNNIKYKQIWYRINFKSLTEKYSLKFRILDLLNVLATFRIYLYIKKEKIDIVCSNSTAVDVGARAAKLANVPHIYYIREFMEKDYKLEYRNKRRMRNLLENSQYVIFISKAVEEYYKTNYNLKNTTQFYNGFIVHDYYKEHDILNKTKIFFVQVGAFQDGKGTINTIEMLYHLNINGFTNWSMEFVGKGAKEYVKKMKSLISEYHLESQVTIGEFCLDIKDKLSGKDILIMNSESEGFGRVTVEGMLAGCLVIGRYSGGTTEIIEDKVNGIAFENEEDFLCAVKQIDADREKYRQLAKSGQKYAMETFDCVNTAKNFMKVVEKCLQQKEM